jgi:predicted phosphohydrolase
VPRVIVTSDLHYDPEGNLTAPKNVEALAGRIADSSPDAVVLAGDLAHELGPFRRCLECFADVGVPVGVLAGNHDVWFDRQAGLSSQLLWERALPEVTRDLGMVWLEEETIRLGPVAVVGSMAWYDYSGVDPTQRASAEEHWREKDRFNNDAVWIDWPWRDVELAEELRLGLVSRLALAAADDGVEKVLVATHVPILEAQMTRKPEDPRWARSNAYFGHLTLGAEVLREPKVVEVVSGHTHTGRDAWVERAPLASIRARVVGSDYDEPAYVIVEL